MTVSASVTTATAARATKRVVILLTIAVVLVASAHPDNPKAINRKKVQIADEPRAQVQIRQEPLPVSPRANDAEVAVGGEVSVLPGGVIVRNILFEMDHPVTPVWAKEEKPFQASAPMSKRDQTKKDKSAAAAIDIKVNVQQDAEETTEQNMQDQPLLTQHEPTRPLDKDTGLEIDVDQKEKKGDIQSNRGNYQVQKENAVGSQTTSPMVLHRLEKLVKELGPSLAVSLSSIQEQDEEKDHGTVPDITMTDQQDIHPDSDIDLNVDLSLGDKANVDAAESELVHKSESSEKVELQENPGPNLLNKNHEDYGNSPQDAFIVPNQNDHLESGLSESEATVIGYGDNMNDQGEGRVLSHHHHHRISVHREPEILELVDRSKKGKKIHSTGQQQQQQQQQGAESYVVTEIEDERVLEEDGKQPSESKGGSKNSIIPETIRNRGLVPKVQGAYHCTPQFCVNVTLSDDGQLATFHIERDLARTGWIALGIGYAMTLADLIIFWPIPESAQDEEHGGSRGAMLSRRTAHAYVEPVLVGHSSGSNDLEDRPEENSLYAEGEYVLHNLNALTSPTAESESMQAFSSEADQKKFIVQFTRPITVQNRAFRLTPGKEQDFCWAVGSFAMDVAANQPGLGPVLEQLRQQEAVQLQKDQDAKKKQIDELNKKLQAENAELQSENKEDHKENTLGTLAGETQGVSKTALSNQAMAASKGYFERQESKRPRPKLRLILRPTLVPVKIPAVGFTLAAFLAELYNQSPQKVKQTPIHCIVPNVWWK
ncbi:hypothetical protein BGW38_005084 [Lunasporangiospora selenospora]|uniref:DOMON domain-containing protein n=1 Tax=Lunasporangiospora selenospora TaxID=979761 RepID=A0A9P6KGL5_9FUNG|nr:hypothetical protein BGW38_005084 [Lunasporangiospora selenospora]